MAYWIQEYGGINKNNSKYRLFYCDYEVDISDLPNNKQKGLPQLASVTNDICPIGSEAFVIESGNKYVLDSNGEWTLIPSSGSGEVYVAPKITVDTTPTTTIYDIDADSLSSITIKANVTKGSKDIVSVTYYIDGTEVNRITSLDNTSYVHNFATPKAETFVVKVEVTDGQKTVSASKTINFVPVTYYGIADSTVTDIDETFIKTLSTVLKNSRKYIYENITMDFGKVVYATPKSFGEITSIKDEVNNFSYYSSFDKSEISINGHDYYLYVLRDNTGADGIQLTFA